VAELGTPAADLQLGFAVRERAEGPAGVRSHVPHVVAWNLTRRCNLACAHCYIAAGSWHSTGDDLRTDECFRIADEILDISPAPMFILSGGEPLLRDDLEKIAEHATKRGATVVIGTNGTLLSADRIRALQSVGVTGVAVSIDSLDATYHDRFRHGEGALEDTLGAVDRLVTHGLDFIVQTSVTAGNRHELPRLAAWAADRGAVSFNVYFLVPTGRGERMHGLSPDDNETTLAGLVDLERHYRGRMMVRSKCQPQIMRHVLGADDGAESPLAVYGTRCPCGV
jgi:MoaA/NifB/PqqE/SkfB family radical SAM enzyme